MRDDRASDATFASPLIDTAALATRLGATGLVVVDLRWQHGEPDFGRRGHETARVPGAVRLDIDRDLSSPVTPRSGRHPLPNPRALVATLARAGIGEGTRVVAYDDAGGSVAGRLWWLLRWLGRDGACAVLDGGLAKWLAEGRPVESGPAPPPAPHPRPLAPVAHPELTASADEVARAASLGLLLLDARAPERYRGEVEPIDARAGHIPGAVNAPWGGSVTPGAVPAFLPPAALRARFTGLGVTGEDASRVVCYCGSGVTACHDLLALEAAGLRGARLYPGSWSEWIALHP